jgi:3-hydroxyisobutyrate dehydrogenase-like beta-hydroxyacid dehydrogenase
MRKDTVLAHELAARLGVRMPAAEASASVLEEALDRGLADADMASVISLLAPTTDSSPRAHEATTAEGEQ